MSVIAIINNINLSLATLYPASGSPGALTTGFGHQARTSKSIPPVAIWIPTEDRYDGPEIHAHTGNGIVRSLRTRSVGMRALLWAAVNYPAVGQPTAEDFSATELLLHQLIACVHSNTRDYELTGGRWQAQNTTEAAEFGRGYELDLFFHVPVVDVATTATGPVQVTSVPQTSQTGPLPPGLTTYSQTP